MKTNVAIELTREERSQLANIIDGKPSSRKATRREIVEICQQHIAGLCESDAVAMDRPTSDKPMTSDLYTIDPGDEKLMARPNDPGYVRGWNTAKRGGKR